MRLLPVAALGLVLNFLVVAFVYRRSLFARQSREEAVAKKSKAAVAGDKAPQPIPRRTIPPTAASTVDSSARA